jgi:hypothetical protein
MAYNQVVASQRLICRKKFHQGENTPLSLLSQAKMDAAHTLASGFTSSLHLRFETAVNPSHIRH